MSAEAFRWLIVGIVVVEFVIEQLLDYLNYKTWQSKRPAAVSRFVDEQQYQLAKNYNADKYRLGLWSSVYSLVILLAMLFGGFALVSEQVSEITDVPWLEGALFFGVLLLGSDLLSLPFQLYSTFKIEEKYGFNKMKLPMFFTDKLKGYLIGAVVGAGLLWLFYQFYAAFPDYFWLLAWGAFFLLSLGITMFYTNLIVPMFNKLSPLEEGPLREKIEAYAQKVDFPLGNVLVIDGSKRSTKANAYFSGLGKVKNIVLYDTLIEKHSEEELVAVLAHEVGHYKRKHIVQGMVISAAVMLLTLWVLSLLIDNPALSAALYSPVPKLHLGLLAFGLLYSPLSTITGLLMNSFSRKNEYEADAYAADTASGAALAQALERLSVDHLSNLHPHPLYVTFHHSHPTLLQRLGSLENREMATA